MEFSSEIKTQFKNAGWIEGRNVSQDIQLPYDDYPEMTLTFLNEYGNLRISCMERNWTEVIDELIIDPDAGKNNLEGDTDYPYYAGLLGKRLFPIGYFLPDGYHICCDADGLVYMIGEYCYYWGKNLYEGLENIISGKWRKSLQLDDDTGKWWNDDAEYVDFEEYIKE